jgi:hypothetical protein
LKPKVFSSHIVRVSKVINAPLSFVFKWCTDYREDDNKITGSRNCRKILQRTKRRVVYVTTYFPKSGRAKMGVNLVTLRPPNSWHLDFVGEEEDEEGDYRLTRLAPRKTRLDMKFSEKYKVPHAPTQVEDMQQVEAIWDKYVAALERDYARGK